MTTPSIQGLAQHILTMSVATPSCDGKTIDSSIPTCVMEGSHIHFATYIDVYVNNIRIPTTDVYTYIYHHTMTKPSIPSCVAVSKFLEP